MAPALPCGGKFFTTNITYHIVHYSVTFTFFVYLRFVLTGSFATVTPVSLAFTGLTAFLRAGFLPGFFVASLALFFLVFLGSSAATASPIVFMASSSIMPSTGIGLAGVIPSLLIGFVMTLPRSSPSMPSACSNSWAHSSSRASSSA